MAFVRSVGIATSFFLLVLALPWGCVFGPWVGLRFALVLVVITPPIWWWLVRSRTDQPVRGAVAGLLIGPLAHVLVMGLISLYANGPSHRRDAGLGDAIFIMIGLALFVAAIVAVPVGPLLGLAAIQVQRRLTALPREGSIPGPR